MLHACIAVVMGRSKKRLVTRKRHRPLSLTITIPVRPITFSVSLPVSCYASAPVGGNLDVLYTRLASLSLPPTWFINRPSSVITICKLRTLVHKVSPPRVHVLVTLSISKEMNWYVSFANCMLNASNCQLFTDCPAIITSAASVMDMLSLVDSSKLCT